MERISKSVQACLITIAASAAFCLGGETINEWNKISEGDLGPGFSPGVVWSPELQRFIYFCGSISHEFKDERPYDVMSLDLAQRQWLNDLPFGIERPERKVGNVIDIGFKSPYFEMHDKNGTTRPNRRHMCLWYNYTIAPWDGKVYMLLCGRLITYDPKTRVWADTNAPAGPMPKTRSHRESLSWSALCADPVNKEILLFGGCGITYTPDASPGTWIYSVDKNAWKKLDLTIEPPPRALSPMVFDPATKKIMLFGGDGLSNLYADTWIYDCPTRTWEEKRPKIGPSPRFGHALVRLPKKGKIVLLGGKGYTSSTDYLATLYRPLPFEAWTYDIADNNWTLIRHFSDSGPADYRSRGSSPAAAAAADDDTIIWIGPGTVKGSVHSSWRWQPPVTPGNTSETLKFGVPPGTLEYRTGPYDPQWYTNKAPARDPSVNGSALNNLPSNQWVALSPPKRPHNRMGGGWSTVTLDTHRNQLLHMGGGHSSYFGNDVAHYDILTNRWTIANRPQFALEYNYDLDGPGLWAFNGAPWGNHNYQAYEYDSTIQRMVYIKGDMTMFYDPVRRTWPFEEKFGNLPFRPSKYNNYLVATPRGVVCWAPKRSNSSLYGLWRLNKSTWVEIQVSGEALPPAVTDGSTITYDSKRDRLLFTTSGTNEIQGQIWAFDFQNNKVHALDPQGMSALKTKRFARESVYLSKNDQLLFGFLISNGAEMLVPIYDCATNRWMGAIIPGSGFLANGKSGASVDLGLTYDPARDLVWGILNNLGAKNAINVLRVDTHSLSIAK